MNIRSLIKKFPSINRHFWLAVLTCCLIIIATPTFAQQNFITTQNQVQSDRNSLLTQGRIAYQAGRYAEATNIWQQANREYETQGNYLDRALALNYLALSSQKQGNWQQATRYIATSLDFLEKDSDLTGNSLNIYAQALNTRGRLELEMGKAEAALATWKQAAIFYKQAEDNIGKLGVWINQAQALQSMGLYRRAQKLLQQIAIELDKQSDPTLKIAGLRSLGLALQVTGDRNYGKEVLQQSLTISQQLNLPEESSVTLFSLGNISRALEQPEQAIAFYQEAATATNQPLLKTKAQLNQLSLLITNQKLPELAQLVSQIEANISQLPRQPSRRSIYTQVNFAKNLIHLSEVETNKDLSINTKPQDLLKKAIAQAQKIQDTKAESYATGILGNWYERQQKNRLGTEYSQKALQLSQSVNDSQLNYQWQWQLARLLTKDKNYNSAIASYKETFNSLESLRSDLVVTNFDTQFSFRESVEPVYRELIGLLLKSQNESSISQENLLEARNTIEALQIAELNDFFREACLDGSPTDIESIDRKAAIIYPIILSDRLEVIVSIPEKPLRHYSTPIAETDLEAEIEELHQTLTVRSRRQFYESARHLYDWVIRPAISDLVDSEIETLVFVPDGSFRNIPMSVLYDGEHYLIENYNVSLTPSLQLLAPRPIEEIELKTLAAGLTEERDGFTPLDYVQVELEDIQNQLDSKVLLDRAFTKETLQTNIESAEYPIVHIATHGQFSSTLEETFLLAWDERIQIKQLDRILHSQTLNRKQGIELLVLSACETAVGDRRAALGLAGMAVQAGAKSTLATLWSVNDRTTAFAIHNFYQQLTQSKATTSKTKALRKAQLELVNSKYFNHPYYWAPFVLVGNWL